MKLMKLEMLQVALSQTSY